MNETKYEVVTYGGGTPGSEAYTAQLTDAVADLGSQEPSLVTDKVPQPNPQLIEPKKEDVVLCTYPNTLDGRLAAWVVRRIAKSHNIPVEFYAEKESEVGPTGMPGQNHIVFTERVFPVRASGKSMLVFCRALDKIWAGAPVPFAKWKRLFPFGVETMTVGSEGHVNANDKSLSAAAWDFFYAERLGFDKRPRIVDYVNDHVTGKYAFNDTKAVVACLETYPTDFQTLDKLVEACDDRKRLAFIVTSGQAVLRYIEQHAPWESED